jgi:predicted kinase
MNGRAGGRVERSGKISTVATLFLIVGLPGAGKTVRAKSLAAERAALRLSPDAWMITLFGEPDAGGKRDVLEGWLIWLALEALRLGTNVVLDFGFWSRDGRSSLRWLARSAGAACQVVYLPVDRATQMERIQRRWIRTPDQTFVMTEADVDRWRTQFDVPDAAELAGGELAGPPAGGPAGLNGLESAGHPCQADKRSLHAVRARRRTLRRGHTWDRSDPAAGDLRELSRSKHAARLQRYSSVNRRR